MNTLELKNDMLRFIVETNDDDILNQIKQFIASIQDEKQIDWSDTISDKEKEGIEEGLADIKANRVISHQEVKASTKKKIEAFKKNNIL